MTLKEFRELTKDLPEDTLIEVGGRGDSDEKQAYGIANYISTREKGKVSLRFDYFIDEISGWPSGETYVKYIGKPIKYP